MGAGKLLRRHEGGGSQKLAGRGDLSSGQLGDAKIGNLGPLGSVGLVPGEQNIGGLDVAMNHALAVRVSQGFGNLLADLADALQRGALAPFDGIGERSSRHEFHHQKRHALVLADIEDGDNSGVRQSAGGARLAEESLAVFAALIAGQRRGENGLDGHDAVHGRVLGAKDAAHGAVAQFIDDLVPSDGLWCAHSLIGITLA